MTVDTYPDFRIDPASVAAAITPRTKMILLNSPANPTGVVARRAEVRALAELAAKHNIALVSDEIYREFCYDAPLVSPARWNDQTIVVDGFSKTYGVTGWRLGFVHGPSAIIDKLTMLQQYTFVCAPHPLQWAAVAALDVDMSEHIDAYRRKRRSRGRRPRRGRLQRREARRRVLCFPASAATGGRHRAASSSPARSRTSCSSSPAASSAAATRTSASPTRPATRRSSAGSKCWQS